MRGVDHRAQVAAYEGYRSNKNEGVFVFSDIAVFHPVNAGDVVGEDLYMCVF